MRQQQSVSMALGDVSWQHGTRLVQEMLQRDRHDCGCVATSSVARRS